MLLSLGFIFQAVFLFLYYTSCVFPHSHDLSLSCLLIFFSVILLTVSGFSAESEAAVGSLRKQKECTSLCKTDVLKMHEGAGAIVLGLQAGPL